MDGTITFEVKPEYADGFAGSLTMPDGSTYDVGAALGKDGKITVEPSDWLAGALDAYEGVQRVASKPATTAPDDGAPRKATTRRSKGGTA